MDEVLRRLQIRVGYENQEIAEEIVTTLCDRICLYVGEPIFNDDGTRAAFPAALESVAVEAATKAWNRRRYEGIVTENLNTLSTQFVQNILDEYKNELDYYKEQLSPTYSANIQFL